MSSKREYYRKERGKAEMKRMLARYEYECKDLNSHMATEEDYIYFERIRKKNKNNYKDCKENVIGEDEGGEED